MRLIAFSLLALACAGCASGMSKEECLYADWRSVGYEDGARGATVAALTPRRETCAKKAGVAPAMNDYLAGRKEGLAQYCTPSNGFAVGAGGGRYAGVCPDAAAGAFLSAYRRGERLHRLELAFQGAERAITDAQRELWELRRQKSETEGVLVAAGTPHDERLSYLAELKNLTERERRIETTISGLENDRDYALGALQDFRERLAYEGGEPRGAVGAQNASY